MKTKSIIPSARLMLILGILSVIALVFLMPKTGRSEGLKNSLGNSFERKLVTWKDGQGRIIMSALVEQFDFEDGQGAVPAYRHPNGGGWVAVSTRLTANVYVGPNAKVYGNTTLYGNARIDGSARVYEDAQVFDGAIVFGDARVFGRAQVYGNARVFGQAQIYDNAEVFVEAWVFGNAQIHQNSQVAGCFEMAAGEAASVEMKTLVNDCQQYQNRPDPHSLAPDEFIKYLNSRDVREVK